MQRTNSSNNTPERTLALPAVRVQDGRFHILAKLIKRGLERFKMFNENNKKKNRRTTTET